HGGEAAAPRLSAPIVRDGRMTDSARVACERQFGPGYRERCRSKRRLLQVISHRSKTASGWALRPAVPGPGQSKNRDNEANLFFVFNKPPWKRTHSGLHRAAPRRRYKLPRPMGWAGQAIAPGPSSLRQTQPENHTVQTNETNPVT